MLEIIARGYRLFCPNGTLSHAQETKFGRKARNFNKRTESVSYYLMLYSKPNI